MERSKDKIKKLRYQKIGRGSTVLRLGGVERMIKPNEKFSADPRDIPAVFADGFICLDTDTTQHEAMKENVGGNVKVFEAVKDEEKTGYWNVIHIETKEIQNEKGLRKLKAEALAINLNS